MPWLDNLRKLEVLRLMNLSMHMVNVEVYSRYAPIYLVQSLPEREFRIKLSCSFCILFICQPIAKFYTPRPIIWNHYLITANIHVTLVIYCHTTYMQ